MVSSSLLREWDLLQGQVVPPLVDAACDDHHPQVWSVGSVADAVAVAAAYRHVRPDGSRSLRVYVTGVGHSGPVKFTLAEIRGVPACARSGAFRRQDRGWVPGRDLADQVILSRPPVPVDLVTLRPGATADRVGERAVRGLRPGGYVVFAPGTSGPLPPGLSPVDDEGRVYRKSVGAPDPIGGPTAEDSRLDDATLFQQEVRNQLVADHVRLARSLARRFSHHGESKDDLEQVALLALVRAARRFDPGRETSFSTYATASILGEIKRHFRDKTWMMRVPRSVQETYLAVKEARETLTHELSGSPTIGQIAERIGITDEMVLEAMEAGENYWPESLDVGLFEGDAGRDVPIVDPAFDRTLERQQLVSLLPRLAPRERLILKRLYFDGWTQRQVADEIGVSQMQVSRLASRTVEKLRDWISA